MRVCSKTFFFIFGQCEKPAIGGKNSLKDSNTEEMQNGMYRFG